MAKKKIMEKLTKEQYLGIFQGYPIDEYTKYEIFRVLEREGYEIVKKEEKPHGWNTDKMYPHLQNKKGN